MKTLNLEKLDEKLAALKTRALESAEGWAKLGRVLFASGMATAVAISQIRDAIRESVEETL